MMEIAEEYEPQYMRLRIYLRASVMGTKFQVSGYIAAEAAENPNYRDKLIEQLEKELQIAVGKWVLANAPAYQPPQPPMPSYSNHSSGIAADITAEIYQEKIKAMLEKPLVLEKFKPSEPTYKDKAASEFEGVEELDPTLWNKGNDLA